MRQAEGQGQPEAEAKVQAEVRDDQLFGEASREGRERGETGEA